LAKRPQRAFASIPGVGNVLKDNASWLGSTVLMKTWTFLTPSRGSGHFWPASLARSFLPVFRAPQPNFIIFPITLLTNQSVRNQIGGRLRFLSSSFAFVYEGCSKLPNNNASERFLKAAFVLYSHYMMCRVCRSQALGCNSAFTCS
jgi:hypothetical protein